MVYIKGVLDLLYLFRERRKKTLKHGMSKNQWGPFVIFSLFCCMGAHCHKHHDGNTGDEGKFERVRVGGEYTEASLQSMFWSNICF